MECSRNQFVLAGSQACWSIQTRQARLVPAKDLMPRPTQIRRLCPRVINSPRQAGLNPNSRCGGVQGHSHSFDTACAALVTTPNRLYRNDINLRTLEYSPCNEQFA